MAPVWVGGHTHVYMLIVRSEHWPPFSQGAREQGPPGKETFRYQMFSLYIFNATSETDLDKSSGTFLFICSYFREMCYIGAT